MISGILNNVATGSATATPAVGSAAVDYVTAIPSALIRIVAGFVKTIGF